jgi:hypothetical protein
MGKSNIGKAGLNVKSSGQKRIYKNNIAALQKRRPNSIF